MKAAIFAYELKVGDVWEGKTIVRIDPPPDNQTSWIWQVWLSDGTITFPMGTSELLIERKMEML